MDRYVEIWKDGSMIRMLYRSGGEIDLRVQKEALRMLNVIDPDNKFPLLIELEADVMIHKEAREFAHRFSNIYSKPAIGMIAYDLSDKIQANFYVHFYKPKTPFKVFYRLADAEQWLLARAQVLPTAAIA